jgi:hypothetical protein
MSHTNVMLMRDLPKLVHPRHVPSYHSSPLMPKVRYSMGHGAAYFQQIAVACSGQVLIQPTIKK